MEVLDAIRRKRAVRAYTERPLPPDIVEGILYAGRRAQSSKNRQPWHFIALQDRSTIDELATLGDFTGPLKTAALVVALVTPDPTDSWWVMFDAGQAASYMQLAALEMGVASCIVSLHRKGRALCSASRTICAATSYCRSATRRTYLRSTRPAHVRAGARLPRSYITSASPITSRNATRQARADRP
jgi:hypothetical protein